MDMITISNPLPALLDSNAYISFEKDLDILLFQTLTSDPKNLKFKHF